MSEYYTLMESNKKLVETTLDQYRYHLDDFVKRYNFIGRIHDSNYKNSFLYNSSWVSVDEKDFTPRVAVILAAYRVLYGTAKMELESNLENISEILPQLEPYLD